MSDKTKEALNYLQNYAYSLKKTSMVSDPPRDKYEKGFLDGWLHARSQMAEKMKPQLDILEADNDQS